MRIDYSGVTEVPGNQLTGEALSMMWTRYAYAASRSRGKDVLEIACGAGQGLGYLAASARLAVGGDYSHELLTVARSHYGARIPLVRFDAQALPFRGETFDVAILYEALYYLNDPDQFMRECRRVLRSGGILMLCTANREWLDFNPSPHSVRYLSAAELRQILTRHGFNAELQAAFPVDRKSARDRTVSLIKRSAVALHLIPKTMKGKAFLKRVFLGRLVTMPAELTAGMAERAVLAPITSDQTPGFKVIYAVGVKQG